MKIHPVVTQTNGMILVQLQTSFVGEVNDAIDQANALAFGDPLVNLTGGNFVDATPTAAASATAALQGITFATELQGTGANQVTIKFVSVGVADASAIAVTGDAITVDITTELAATRTTAQIVALFADFQSATVTTDGGHTSATLTGSSAPAVAITDPVDFTGGTAAYTASFLFAFPASDLWVGITTQLAAYTARFMTQLPLVFGIPTTSAVAGPLDCITSDPKRAAKYWIATIEGRIATAMQQLRQKTPLGTQSDATV
jgi:hypothetical protein